MRIQEYLTCAIQNIQVLVKYSAMPKRTLAMALNPVKKTLTKATNAAFVSISNLIHRINCALPANIMNPVYTDV